MVNDENGTRGGQWNPGGEPPPTGSGSRQPKGNWAEWCRDKVKTLSWGKATVAGLIGALLVLLVLPLLFGVNPYDLIRGNVKTANQGQKVAIVSSSGGNVPAVAKNVTQSIVNIDVRTNSPQTPTTTATPTIGVGSGVIIRADGYIITNNHVVGGASSITVTLSDTKKYTGTLVGTNPTRDIAVVKIAAMGLKPIAVGNSDNLVVGQLVVAIGSPLGFQQTVTSGIVSALNRSVQAQNNSGQIEQLNGLIQTDAPINPGNSGGALCDASSRLIGINAVIATQTGGSEGIAFSIPSNTAVGVAHQIMGRR